MHAGEHVCLCCARRAGKWWHLVSAKGITYCLCAEHALEFFGKREGE